MCNNKSINNYVIPFNHELATISGACGLTTEDIIKFKSAVNRKLTELADEYECKVAPSHLIEAIEGVVSSDPVYLRCFVYYTIMEQIESGKIP